MHACEVVIANFIYGSQTCGAEANKTVPGEFEGEKHFICDEHYYRYWTYKPVYVTVRFSNVETGEKVEIILTRAFAEEFVKLLNTAGMEATIVD